MLPKRLSWIGWLLLAGSWSAFAASQAQDNGPLPPPKGPFFSSKPLLYSGEEPSVDAVRALDGPETYVLPVVPGSVNSYPYGYAPFTMNPNQLPFQQMPPQPQGWGAQRPNYSNYPNYPLYPGPQYYPGNGGYQGFAPFPGQIRP
jgi:hypothetical protein